MPGTKCEGCGAEPEGYELYDYCAECSKNLCPTCMKKGCCGNTPAESGEEADFPDEEAEVQMDPKLMENPDDGQEDV